ncbi:MAG TPA: HAD-IIIA family hydrolase [Bacteroidia bacterium]|nr:HAD-IIIA family hydrolase [Bacteroidia bacterium]
MLKKELNTKAKKIKLLLTDVDGVLTDNGVYYGADGEQLKRFSIRDGMGVERLLKLAEVETGIITGELSPSVAKRAEKLKIKELHLGIKNKLLVLNEIVKKRKLSLEQVAYIGDDVNDLEVMEHVGLTACPADAMDMVKQQVYYICSQNGGYGCFREFAELIINAKKQKK